MKKAPFNKKAFLRTVEVMIAIVIALMFLTFMLQQKVQAKEKKELDLSALMNDDFFRACALVDNHTCMREIVQSKIPRGYDFAVNNSIYYTPETRHDIYIESFLISGTFASTDVKEVRVYYWIK